MSVTMKLRSCPRRLHVRGHLAALCLTGTHTELNEYFAFGSNMKTCSGFPEALRDS